jgi:hypothetical protein
VNDNPWHRLPKEPPHVLLEDQEKAETFNLKAKKARPHHFLHLDLIPEPFVGRPDAPVVLLGNNPGVKSPETAADRRKPAFADRLRKNLLHALSSDTFPFLYLDPGPNIPPRSREWWDRKLKHLFREFGPDQDVARSILARSILAVEFFPYVSHRFGHGRLSLPSQQYGFNLVRNAMKRGAVIVLTRGRRRWEKAVEDLAKYPRLVRLKEVQRAPITPDNCPDPDQYQAIARAIRATLS